MRSRARQLCGDGGGGVRAWAEAPTNPDESLAAKVAALQERSTYPGDGPHAVEAVETHMAWVFLTGAHAYKLKKPVRYDFLDFATLAARKHACDEEVRLNRRLAPDVYLGVVPLTRDRRGRIGVGGTGRTIDWLVQMRQLPRDRMLDVLIRRRQVEPEDVSRLGLLLGRFYDRAPRIDLRPPEYVRRVQRDLEANLRELARPTLGLASAHVERVGAALRGFLHRCAHLLWERAAAGRIVEGHGDLRPEHVCLENPPVIIDCIEFNPEFRSVDPADDLALLQLECERLGDARVSARVVDVYREATCDAPPPGLMHLYVSHRACLRAKLAAWHTIEAGRDDHEHWLERAREYLDLAAAHAGR